MAIYTDKDKSAQRKNIYIIGISCFRFLFVRINRQKVRGMDMSRRLRALAGLLLFGCAISQAVAAGGEYPNRQIKIVVPFPAGAGPDQVARMMAQHLQNAFGQTVLLENRAGALGSI